MSSLESHLSVPKSRCLDQANDIVPKRPGFSKVGRIAATALLLITSALASGCARTITAPCPPSPCPEPVPKRRVQPRPSPRHKPISTFEQVMEEKDVQKLKDIRIDIGEIEDQAALCCKKLIPEVNAEMKRVLLKHFAKLHVLRGKYKRDIKLVAKIDTLLVDVRYLLKKYYEIDA